MQRSETTYRTRPRWMWPALAVIFAVWAVGLVLILAREDRRAPESARTGIHPSIDSGVTMLARSTTARATAIERLRAFVVRSETMEGERNYTSIGLRRLADAIEAIAGLDRAIMVAPYCDSLRAAAERLQTDTVAERRAAAARRAFVIVADALRELRRNAPSHEESSDTALIESARAIDPKQPLLEQREPVREVFARSYRIIDAMAREHP